MAKIGDTATARQLGKNVVNLDAMYFCVKCPECGEPCWKGRRACNGDVAIYRCYTCVANECGRKPAKPGTKSRQRGGYIAVKLQRDDPLFGMASNGWVQEHRYVMAVHLDRELRSDEVVHHINNIKNDNRIENLEIWIKGHPNGASASDLLRERLSTMPIVDLAEFIRQHRPELVHHIRQMCG